MIEADYLVVGAGAMGLAFTDSILTDSPDATVAIVDRRGRPGGHWTDAYPFVRLHQPSAFYGVNSRPLGSDRIDTIGGNAGLYELASGSEVCAYFDRVMRERFLPSGRVQYHPLTTFDAASNEVLHIPTGDRTPVGARTVVDATYQAVTIPATHTPGFSVDPGAALIPVNGLGHLHTTPPAYVVIGAGKTGMDAVLHLLANGVDPDAITWIMPRDSWILDRKNIQPGPDFIAGTVGGAARQNELIAEATSIDALFDALEAEGLLLRIDPAVRPTMYRCATVTQAELDQLRRITNVVRLGRVTAVEATRIVLDDGEVATSPGTLHVDCTADGLARRPLVPVFDDANITLQPVRTCQQVFSAALIGHVEATRDNDEEKNTFCAPVPHPDSDVDFLRCALASTRNSATWQFDAEIRSWLRDARLDGFSAARSGHGNGNRAELMAIARRLVEATGPALERLESLLAEHDQAG
ncbi:MAG: NAD(P)/FAD-dependent oxidoreductase [Actinomycetota bacterium]